MGPRQVTHLPMRGVFYFSWHKHKIEVVNVFLRLIRNKLSKWGKGSCQSYNNVAERRQCDSSPRPLDRHAQDIIIEQPLAYFFRPGNFTSATLQINNFVGYG